MADTILERVLAMLREVCSEMEDAGGWDGMTATVRALLAEAENDPLAAYDRVVSSGGDPPVLTDLDRLAQRVSAVEHCLRAWGLSAGRDG